MAVQQLAEAFVRGSAAEQNKTALKLVAALDKAAGSGTRDKENNRSKATLEAAQQCLKAVQQRLEQAGSSPDTLDPLVAVARASMAALAAQTPAAAAPTLAARRYNLARRLVSCKAFEAAREEGWILFQQLNDQQHGGGKAGSTAAPTAETVSMMVGTALTLVLCCVEGRLLHSSQALQGLLAAAEALPAWLRCGRGGPASFLWWGASPSLPFPMTASSLPLLQQAEARGGIQARRSRPQVLVQGSRSSVGAAGMGGAARRGQRHAGRCR